MAAPTNGLVGEWLLNGNANDSSGNGNNGTASNVTWTTTDAGPQAQNGSFNGSNSIVTVPSSSVLNPTAISVSLRYKPIALADNSGIVGKWSYQPNSGGTNQWTIYQNANGKIGFALNAGGSITGVASTTIANDTTHMYNIVAMYDGAQIKLYIDNVNEASVAKT